jgi:hypothetical protein
LKKLISIALLTILFLAPTSANAGEIRLSADGQSVIVPVDIFQRRQLDLEKYDAMKVYVAKIEAEIVKLRDQEAVRETLLAQERRLAENEIAKWVVAHDRADRRAKMPGLGLGVGYGSNGEFVGVVGLVWKPF